MEMIQVDRIDLGKRLSKGVEVLGAIQQATFKATAASLEAISAAVADIKAALAAFAPEEPPSSPAPDPVQPEMRVCECGCGVTFKPKRVDQRFASLPCRRRGQIAAHATAPTPVRSAPSAPPSARPDRIAVCESCRRNFAVATHAGPVPKTCRRSDCRPVDVSHAGPSQTL